MRHVRAGGHAIMSGFVAKGQEENDGSSGGDVNERA